MVAQALVAAGNAVEAFTRQLAWRLRWWLLGLPAGTGKATLRATLKLWLGFPPSRSGVFSPGNGPAMRSPVLGAAIDDLGLLRRVVRASARITHTDPKATFGALAVALAARLASEGSTVEGGRFTEELRRLLADEPADEFLTLVDHAVASVTAHDSTSAFAASLGLEKGVSGYVYHTVPVVLRAWLAHQDEFRTAVMDVIQCGGDADSTAAIVGGIVGSAVGKEGIPSEWLAGLWEWPRTVAWMERLAAHVYEARLQDAAARPLRLPIYGLLPRNLLFLLVVLGHGMRRLLPPY